MLYMTDTERFALYNELVDSTSGIPDVQWLISQAESPFWENAVLTNDWRNHIPECVVKTWTLLAIEARVICVAMAQQRASIEEWE